MTELTTRIETKVFVAASVVLFAAFAFQLVYHAVRISPTVDEPPHILAGHRHWQCGDFGINPEHPPLLKLLATAPLNFMNLKEPPWECGSKLTSKFDMFSYGNTFVVENGIDRVVVPARIGASLMSMLLALLVFFAAWEMFGRWEAVTALSILAFEPSLIGHGSIVLTDMAISATSFAAMYALYRFGKDQSWSRFAVAGIAFGLMFGAKHSAVFFVGFFVLLLIVDVVLFRLPEPPAPRPLLRRLGAFAGMIVVGVAILWALYGFHYYSIPNTSASGISIGDYIKENGRPEMITSLSARVTEAVSHTHMLPESYVLGMADVIAWGSRNTNIFGRAYPTGKWFYFPVTFVVKSSLLLLLLLPTGFIFIYFNRDKWREGIYLLVPAIGYFVIASSSSFTNGVRHLLPFYPYVIVLAAAGAVWFCQKFYYFRYILAALLIYHATVAVRTAPNYIAFANDFWGGYENTYKIFRGGNTDLGGSIKQVNEYLARESINECWISGMVHPELMKFEQPCRPMPAGLRPFVSRNVIDAVPPVIEGTVILSVNELPPQGGDEYVPIAQSEPIALIGGNMFVYRGRFDIPLAAAISRFHRSGAFLRNNDVENAITEAREGITLAPNDPRPHLALGRALIRAGQKDEARSELETAVVLAKPEPRFRNHEVQAQQQLDRTNP
ncbi:MAG TPA: glycosyltransferase family 39 protein [Pyrinomonadaceae bacterium]|nr:glycosyltransferase family 39 protein [Pyrinomonadaceae bacterium]